MRIVAWNCNMALDRKIDVLLGLKPDIAIVCECAAPDRLRLRGAASWLESEPVWIGQNPNKGLAVLAFNGYAADLSPLYNPALRFIAPVHVTGPVECHLLAVWAQNASAGSIRKHQLGPLRRALTLYRAWLSERPSVVAGDLNSNVIWDKPGWRINHATQVKILEGIGLVSAYHRFHGEAHGEETIPTIYWRDRRIDGPTYHIDYVFIPEPWIAKLKGLAVGSFAEWCGAGLSDHVPIVVEVDL
jgi:exodeoxyribonuclease-3